MVSDIAGNGVSIAQFTLRDTSVLAKAAVRPQSQAEQTLGEVLTSLKGSGSSLAASMARSKIDQTRIRLAGLQLAAGSAAAMGDGRLARGVAQDIRDAARDLNRLFSGNGASTAGVQPPVPKPLIPGTTESEAPLTAAQSAARQIRATLGYGSAGAIADADLGALKTDAAEITGALNKVMKRLQLTGMNPLLASADRGAMQTMLGAATGELSKLQTLTSGAGAKVNLKA